MENIEPPVNFDAYKKNNINKRSIYFSLSWTFFIISIVLQIGTCTIPNPALRTKNDVERMLVLPATAAGIGIFFAVIQMALAKKQRIRGLGPFVANCLLLLMVIFFNIIGGQGGAG